MDQARILVVDDDPEVLSLVSAFLRSLNYPSVTVSSAEEAIALLYVSHERIDLVLTDYEMPGMNGIELARRIAQFKPSLRILGMSGGSAAFDEGKLSCLVKPFGIDELQRAIETRLAQTPLRYPA